MTPSKIEVTAEVQEKKETTPIEPTPPADDVKLDEIKKESVPVVEGETLNFCLFCSFKNIFQYFSFFSRPRACWDNSRGGITCCS